MITFWVFFWESETFLYRHICPQIIFRSIFTFRFWFFNFDSTVCFSWFLVSNNFFSNFQSQFVSTLKMFVKRIKLLLDIAKHSTNILLVCNSVLASKFNQNKSLLWLLSKIYKTFAKFLQQIFMQYKYLF